MKEEGPSGGLACTLRGKWTTGSAWALGAYVAAILVTLPVLPLLWIPLRDQFGAVAERSLTVFLVLLGLAIGVGFLRRSLSWKASPLLLAAAGIYGWFLWILENPVEKVHFAEYGFLSYFSFRYFQARGHASNENEGEKHLGSKDRRALRIRALALVFSVGLLDEFIQYLLPNRFGDLRDVGFNWLAGLLGLVVSEKWDGL